MRKINEEPDENCEDIENFAKPVRFLRYKRLTTEEDEMEDLGEPYYDKKNHESAFDLADKLENLGCLVKVCQQVAESMSDGKDLSFVLYKYVAHELKEIEKSVRNL